ncbi:hypothetical protein [Brevundimonas sp. PAMC22021]|uniref:hypothetical protein n=1 Tax=Brevundimonas sp. PAMC22021 TaxID=2861285 RepID=UPI001C6273E4|nr:hypothetical protein [Brevundimonas sp. PAMC22021]QYF86993.1 hypothetical protein KY493_00215 [Brevundimonas sp. PAMC22021]
MRALSTALITMTATLVAAACAPVVAGGPPMAVLPGLQETAQVRNIYMSSDWLRAEDDFEDTFVDEVGDELQRCMWGTAPVDVRIHLDHLDRDGRLARLLNGGGEHRLSGTVEFVDPNRNNAVVGRFPVSTVVRDSGGLAGLVADRQMMVSEAFGRATCEEGFGRNPRGPRVTNATAG